MPTPIDTYLARVSHPRARRTLAALRAQLAKLLPTATETLSYGMPAFRLPNGKVAAGFAFFSKHCGYYPHSGNVVARVKPLLAGFRTTAGGVTFPPERPLPAAAVRALVAARLEDLARVSHAATKATRRKSGRKTASAPERSARKPPPGRPAARTSARAPPPRRRPRR